jgi:hypothetical protein
MYIFSLAFLIASTVAMSKRADHSNAMVEKYGWTSVPHDQSVLLKDVSPWDPANYSVSEIQVPDSEIAKKVTEYAKERLPEQVFNHSMRVFYYGQYSHMSSQWNLKAKGWFINSFTLAKKALDIPS